VPREVEHFDCALPDDLVFEAFVDLDGLNVAGRHAVHVLDDFVQFVERGGAGHGGHDATELQPGAKGCQSQPVVQKHSLSSLIAQHVAAYPHPGIVGPVAQEESMGMVTHPHASGVVPKHVQGAASWPLAAALVPSDEPTAPTVVRPPHAESTTATMIADLMPARLATCRAEVSLHSAPRQFKPDQYPPAAGHSRHSRHSGQRAHSRRFKQKLDDSRPV